MHTTPNRGLRYPDPSDSPNGPQQIQNLATDVDNAMALIFGKMWRTSGFSGVLTTATAYVVTMDVARTNGGMTFDNVNDALIVPVDGLYDVTCWLYVSNGGYTGQMTGWVRRGRSGVADADVMQGQLVNKSNASRDALDSWTHKAVPLKANDTLKLIAYAYDANLKYWGSNEWSGCILSANYVAPLGTATPV